MQIKENIRALRHWPLCGEFTGTGEFPTQRASYAENVSIWWRHHEIPIPAGFIIHDLTSSHLACSGVPETPIDGSVLDSLEDTNYDTCITPLSHGSDRAKITLEIFDCMGQLQVVTAISKDASCGAPGVVLAAETVNGYLVECALEDDAENTTLKFRACRYKCLSNNCCSFVHIHFFDLRVRRVQNTQWKLCDIQIYFP